MLCVVLVVVGVRLAETGKLRVVTPFGSMSPPERRGRNARLSPRESTLPMCSPRHHCARRGSPSGCAGSFHARLVKPGSDLTPACTSLALMVYSYFAVLAVCARVCTHSLHALRVLKAPHLVVGVLGRLLVFRSSGRLNRPFGAPTDRQPPERYRRSPTLWCLCAHVHTPSGRPERNRLAAFVPWHREGGGGAPTASHGWLAVTVTERDCYAPARSSSSREVFVELLHVDVRLYMCLDACIWSISWAHLM